MVIRSFVQRRVGRFWRPAARCLCHLGLLGLDSAVDGRYNLYVQPLDGLIVLCMQDWSSTTGDGAILGAMSGWGLGVIEFFLSGVCHQISTHSLYYDGLPLPLCARCTGTFLGLIVGLLALWIWGQGRRTGLPSVRVMVFLAALVALWALDGANSWLGPLLAGGPLYTPNNALRLLTGVGMGTVLAVLLYPILNYAMWGSADSRRVGDGRSFWFVALMETALAAITLLWRGAPYGLMVALVTMSVAVSLTLINGTLVILLAHREGYAHDHAQRWFVSLLGLGLALGETGGLALLRRALIG